MDRKYPGVTQRMDRKYAEITKSMDQIIYPAVTERLDGKCAPKPKTTDQKYPGIAKRSNRKYAAVTKHAHWRGRGVTKLLQVALLCGLTPLSNGNGKAII